MALRTISVAPAFRMVGTGVANFQHNAQMGVSLQCLGHPHPWVCLQNQNCYLEVVGLVLTNLTLLRLIFELEFDIIVSTGDEQTIVHL